MIFFSEKPFRALCSSKMIAPHDERIDIVMLARHASEMQIDRPSAGKVEGRAQISERLCDFK